MTIDRILPLAAMACYPGSPHMDMVMYLGAFRGQTMRMWLLTTAEGCTVCLDDLELTPKEPRCGGESGQRWWDLGVVDRLNARFVQLRVRGMSPGQARESLLLLTREIDFVPQGGREEVEEALFGISRSNAGHTTLRPGRVEVGEATDLEATYVAGPRGLPAGARVRFAIPRGFSRPQTQDQHAPGYIRVRAAGTEGDVQVAVQIESMRLSDDSHEQFDIICLLPEGLAAGGRIVVSYRTEEMHIFPWLRDEVERPYWFAHLVPFAAAVAVDERKRWVELAPDHSHSFETVAGHAERLHLILPGRRREDEEVVLRGIFTDRFRNVPTPRGIPIDIRLRIADKAGERDLGRPRGKFEAPHRFRLPLGKLEPGIYRIRAYDDATGECLAQSNPLEIVDDDSDRLNIYWGEIHGHTEMSDGIGAFEEMFRYARDEGCQDFAAATDHACYFTDNEWEWMQDVANSFNERGRFVTLLGYEWAGQQGHRCIYARGRRLKLFRGMCEPESSLDVVYSHFHENEDIVTGPHHTGAGGGLEHHDPSIERFIEVYSMWGASDRIGAPKAPLFPSDHPFPAHEWLRAGAMLGFTGGGDCHEGKSGWTPDDPLGQGTALHGFAHQLRYRSGLTAALMPELRRRELVEALRQRRTYATTGARILLNFEVSDVQMGQQGKAKRAEVEAEVHAVSDLARLEVIREGKVVHSVDVAGLDAELEWEDPVPVGESAWYYLHVIQRDGEEAWSSPVWLRGK
ncbi:MAG: CehA/McbA family metallohydrolase [Armatimonadota bacterium]